jgi:hypothetical protein
MKVKRDIKQYNGQKKDTRTNGQIKNHKQENKEKKPNKSKIRMI